MTTDVENTGSAEAGCLPYLIHLCSRKGSRKQTSSKKCDTISCTTMVPAYSPPDTHKAQDCGGITSQYPPFRCSPAPRDANQLMAYIERLALESHRLGSLDLDHLITLSRVNVQRAAMENILAVGMNMEWMIDDDSISLFNLSRPQKPTDHISYSPRPTPVQLSIPHHPWLDLFPFPRMRDNLISSSDYFDDEELCRDLMGFWDTHDSRATLLVCGEPHNPRNWEVTPGFLMKWGWLLRGCSELVASSNRWRANPGKRPLFRRSTEKSK
ncbi:unnamed protein product [Penicillium egyptiacum]|uniref:Uncharacterized protein n=1 Tax=Penicillium egyptiacum TaxID=1303716 RepID=A0A9W4KMG3_9EURO|nr:unnamed protein product [Penicillium egyptiacum]